MAKTSTPHRYIVILSGGTGPRLWPLSRTTHPKQFLNLFGEQSLLQTTITRHYSYLPKENIYVIANNRNRKLLTSHLRGFIPAKNIIFEPSRRNTLMAAAYATAIICQKDPNAIISILPSDHLIRPNTKYLIDIKKAQDKAESFNGLVLIGIKPSYPDTSYGYFHINSDLSVDKFIEKPQEDLAAKLLKNSYYWNSGIYTFSGETLSLLLQKHQPAYYRLYQKLITPPTTPDTISSVYRISDTLSFDYGLSQKNPPMTAIKASFHWNDVGEWQSIYQELPKDKQQNATINPALIETLNSSNCLVHNSNKNKLVALVGMKNLAVIDTPDALLVCPLDQSLSVRDLVAKIVKRKDTIKYFAPDEKK